MGKLVRGPTWHCLRPNSGGEWGNFGKECVLLGGFFGNMLCWLGNLVGDKS